MNTQDLVLLPEEEELARLRARMADVEDELADRELELATRRRELADFQTRYLAIVGTRMAELDQLGAQIAAILAQRERTPEAEVAAERAFEQARESAEALGDDPETLAQAADEAARVIPPDLKTLFRKAAKAVHPDRAVDQVDRALRERLMAKANAAYAAGDMEALQGVLDEWSTHPQAVTGEGAGAELIRVIRAIATVEARLAALAQELAAVECGSLATLFLQVQEAQEGCRDLLQEMGDELDTRIAGTRRRLADLRV